jgi:hypothetical protein
MGPRLAVRAGGQPLNVYSWTWHGRRGAAPLHTNVTRDSLTSAAAPTNPGAYDLASDAAPAAGRPLSVPARNRAAFSSQSRRFEGATAVGPGPGAYSPAARWLTPSFNVTLDA